MPTLEAPQPFASTAPFVKQSCLIRAPRSKVYEAWTKPEIVKQWFGPTNRHCPVAILDVREGGAYRLEVNTNDDAVLAPGAPRTSAAEGVYTEVVPNERLQFTWMPSWNPGEESLVTVTFADAQGGTEVTILHERISSDGCQGYGQGWAGSLQKLANLLGA